ncbi:MAG: carbohydrate kinase [Actinobacteria bacterium]|nr:MAG: carbohydrate kinase [Actinomycetota bacterium]TML82301.1 MAG: carbohydrate kinase [Actinomycetota bacterium]
MPGLRIFALDVGTSSVRAHRFDETAEELGEPARREYSGEADADRIVQLTREAIEEAGGAEGVDAVATSCFGHSLLALDKAGRPLTPILSWRDTRSADAADWLRRRLDNETVHARTGCQIHTSYWPAKLAWLAQEDAEVFRTADRFVSFCDYLYEQLLGRRVGAGIAMASPTGLVDLRRRTWDEELLDTLRIDEERLPEISDAPVDGWFPALLDGACSNFGVGCVTRERAALMIGTSGAVRTVYETARPQPRPGLFLHWVDDTRVVEGGSLSDGGNLYAWIEATLADGGGSLAGRDPDSHGLTFLTLLGGERSPGWHQHAKGAIHGLTFDTTPLDLRQAGLEGVAFRFADVAELMPEIEEVVATGGALLHDPDWVQIMADALGRPLTTSGVEEASLRGAAVLALERLGAPPAPAQLGRVVQPRRDRTEAFRAARERQRRLYEVVTSEPTS